MNFSCVGTIPTIEIEIYQREDAYFPNSGVRNNLQSKLLTESFEYHYLNNELYRNYCKKKCITIDDVKKDIRKIPLIPSTIFKTSNIRTETHERTVKKCLSSGTQGSVSTIERDNTTLERFLGSVRNALDNVYCIEDAIVLNLGPAAEEAQDIWFSYVMSVTDMIFPTIDYVKDGTFLLDKVSEDLDKFKDEYENVLIIGAPVMFLELQKYFIQKDLKISFGDKIFVVTAGGWKKNQGQAISKSEFKECCKSMFSGITDDRIRDAFNMVELNTILPECEYGSKHIPLWLDVFALDLDTYEIAEDGITGLLGFLDASPTSYPGFIMSGDLGRITYVDNCPCGRSGRCVEFERRINTIESRGCALKIEKNILK